MDLRIKTDTTSEILATDEGGGAIEQYLKYEDAQTAELALIDDMITEVRAHFEKITGLSFVQKTYVVYFRHEDKPFVLPVSPVISVDKVEEVDVEGTGTELTLNSDYHKKGMYEVEILCDAGSIANPFRTFSGKYDLRVEFKAGYGHDDTESLPGDLMGAVKKQVKQWYDNRDDFYEMKILGSIQAVLRRHQRNVL